jgi:glycosyltransferase involved in cell wall biosynthesis
MKILADANPVYSGHLTGIGYFTDELLTHLQKYAGVEGFAFNFRESRSPNIKYPVREQKILPGKLLSYPRYLKVDVPLKTFFSLKGVDVVLGTNYILPPTGKVPNIATVHDLCFVDHPEWVQSRNARILRTMLGKTLNRSSGLITISEFSAERIRQVYKYKKPILVVSIPPKKSIAGTKRPAGIEEVVSGSYFLFVSTIEPRKNIKTMLDAFEALPTETQSKHPLVLVGKPGWDPETLERLRSKANHNIHYLDYVSEAERNWLYANAMATIIPSHYEGFGMMTLESLDAGAPTITSDIAPQREILGRLGEYFAPTDTASLKKIMEKFTNTSYREIALQKQSSVLSSYSWDKTAQDVFDFIEKVAIR